MTNKKKFVPGKTYIPVSGKVFDEKEVNNVIKVAKEGWWTEGKFAQKFSGDFRHLLNIKYVSLVNSGSSANLLAVAALTADILGSKKLERGDEFITTGLAFPTTINPGLIYGLRPVFIDIDKYTLNIDANKIEQAITAKTKLVILAHTLGIPFNLKKILELKKKYGFWLIEDCCDALGSRWNSKLLGTFGDIATFSFYPAHLITMGEGGALITNNSLLFRLIKQFRDWGRDCWCDTGKDDTCNKRFDWKLGKLPKGYDHKYVYSQIGYNLKLTDMQAAIGVAQLDKLAGFIESRKRNYKKLQTIFSKYSEYLDFASIDQKADPCWFGFPILVKPKAPFTRNDIVNFLEKNKIGTRPIFAGNILKHPGYLKIKKKISGTLENCDFVMNNGFWIGVHPAISDKQIMYIEKIISLFLSVYNSIRKV